MPSSTDDRARRWSERGWLLALVLIFAAVRIYYPALDGPFIYDDFEAIVENESIRDLGDPLSVLSPPDETPMAGRPISNLSMAMSYSLGGLDARVFRLFNLALHALVGVLLFAFVRLTLRSPRVAPRLGELATPLALAAALLWLVHPLQSEVVLYVTLRTESLASLFYLMALVGSIRAWDRETGGGRAEILAIAACALGLASKEVAVTAPLMVVLWDWSFRSESAGELWRIRKRLYVGLAACWTVTAALLVAGPRAESVGFSLSVGPWSYLLQQCELIPHYLRLIFWPAPLVLDYGYPTAISVLEAAPGATLLVVLLAVTVVGLSRRHPAAFAGAWFFVLLAPSSSFVPIATEAGAERRVYLASAGVIALVLAVLPLLRRAMSGAAAKGFRSGLALLLSGLALGAVAGLLAALTAERSADYSSRVRIWTTVVKARPGNYRGFNNLGLALADEGRSEEAEESFRAALGLREDYPDAQSNLCNALRARGDLMQAMTHCRRALELAPDLAEAHNNLGAVLGEAGALEEAIVHFRRALDLEPGYEAARRNLEVALEIDPDSSRKAE